MKSYGKKAFSVFFCGLVLIFLTSAAAGQNMFRKVNDFDGDGKADFAVTRNEGGNKIWYVWQTTGGFTAFQWGFATDENAAGDYDGDGKTDPGIFRKEVLTPSTMRYSFWVNRSQQGVMSLIIGPTNDFPESVAYQQDFNGNGKTDVAFTIENNARYWVHWDGGGSVAYDNPGGTFIKLGDMIGDGRADGAAYNPTSHVVSIREPGLGPIQTIAFGMPGDEYVAADFDGDSKGDLTVFRQSNGQWWWLRSSDNVVNAATFGTSGDVPVPADYDGDGKTDIAVWRAGAQSNYWVYGSQVGVFVFAWGIASDSVVRY